MDHLVISTSLNPRSRSRAMAKFAHAHLLQLGVEADFIDLQEYPLPFCDAGACYKDANALEMEERISAAKGILVATPVYNFSGNAAAKNLIELTGSAWENKVAGFMGAAGGHSSYMSLMVLANQLMFDFRTIIIPRFVYAVGEDFDGGEVKSEKIQGRLEQLSSELVRFTKGLG